MPTECLVLFELFSQALSILNISFVSLHNISVVLKIMVYLALNLSMCKLNFKDKNSAISSCFLRVNIEYDNK